MIGNRCFIFVRLKISCQVGRLKLTTQKQFGDVPTFQFIARILTELPNAEYSCFLFVALCSKFFGFSNKQ